MTILTGSFVSVWDEGTVQTQGTLNTKTGEVTAKFVNVPDLGSLKREYFEDEAEDIYEVCTECHEYILKSEMNPGIGHDLNEEQVCSNKDCESREEN
ncbi:MAG: hypothetical protein NT096_00075 [Proteobacteria bacterium]|nr:hypothetical protein [Pseudomonadota bacterium]